MSKRNQVEFTKAMKHTHTILIPQMLPIHFQFLRHILTKAGYHIEVCQSHDQRVINEGLQNVHNDMCYPALLVIGQFIDALKSGRYDVNHVALAITQTGGGCRASNYIHLLRKALKQAGFPQVPVISVNFSGLEKNSGFHLSLKMLFQVAVGFLYGDAIMWLANQVKPYECVTGSCDRLTARWIETLCDQSDSFAYLRIKHNLTQLVHDYAALPRREETKARVGIVGEIYMKYSPLGNNELEALLIRENCEPVVSGVLDFGLYCLENVQIDHAYYGRNRYTCHIAAWAKRRLIKIQQTVIDVIQSEGTFRAPAPFAKVIEGAEEMINRGVKMGEGWLLTGEMIELIHSGVANIVCCQPFGCLPNHIVAKGMMRKIKDKYPNANIVALDFDPSATAVNQENRLKLMLANAHQNNEALTSHKIKPAMPKETV